MMLRQAIAIVSLFGIVMTNPIAAPGKPYDPMQSQRLIEFRKTIGFDAARAQETRVAQVLLDWEGLRSPPELEDWNRRVDVSKDEEGGMTVSIDFSKNDEQVNLSIQVFDPRTNRAPESLLIKADSVTSMNIPYLRGPHDLGTLSLISPSQPTRRVFWFFHNVHAEVSVYKTAVPALTVARWLQRQLELNTRY